MFLAKTKNSGKFKALFEVLFQNITTVCMTIDAKGMRSEILTNQNILILVDLPAENFDEYVFDFDKPQHVGLGSHINQFFKSVKNKTHIIFSINKPLVLDIAIISQVDDYVVSLMATVENTQNIAKTAIATYDQSAVRISNTTFNQVCKSFKSPLVNVTKRNGQLSFSFEISGISIKTVTFGKASPEDVNLFFQTFKSDQFVRICKISSFASHPIEIYAEKEKPLAVFVKSTAGTVKLLLSPVEE